MLTGGYEATAQELKRRILDLIPAHPQIMDMDEPWGLFKIPGFRCDDLGPSLAQASAALGAAQRAYRQAKGE